jgi:hypothetical protein
MAPQVFLGRAKGTHERGVLVVLVRRRSPLALTPMARVDRPGFSFPMLQMYVSGVLVILKVYCSCSLWMLQM